MSGNKMSNSQEIKVSTKLFKWAVNIFLNDIRQQTTWSNFFINIFLIIKWLLPIEVKPVLKSVPNLV